MSRTVNCEQGFATEAGPWLRTGKGAGCSFCFAFVLCPGGLAPARQARHHHGAINYKRNEVVTEAPIEKSKSQPSGHRPGVSLLVRTHSALTPLLTALIPTPPPRTCVYTDPRSFTGHLTTSKPATKQEPPPQMLAVCSDTKTSGCRAPPPPPLQFLRYRLLNVALPLSELRITRKDSLRPFPVRFPLSLLPSSLPVSLPPFLSRPLGRAWRSKVPGITAFRSVL